MDSKLLDALKARAAIEAERAAIVNEGHVAAIAQILAGDDEEHELVLPALEVLFVLSSAEHALRTRIGAVDGLVNNVKKFMSRGRLRQKKLALMVYKNLQMAVPAAREDVISPLSEITNDAGLVAPLIGAAEAGKSSEDPMSPSLLLGKKVGVVKARPGLSQGARIRPTAPTAPAALSMATSGVSTISLFIEGMQTIEARTQVEQAMLKREGVISFFTDIADEKIVIRTTLSVDDLYAHIWEACKMRASTVKGDYASFKPSGYLDESTQKGGWLWGISSLLQIIAVKNDEQVPPTPVKQTPAKPARAQAAAAGHGEKQAGWLGGWW